MMFFWEFWVEYGFLEGKNHISRFSSHQLGIIDNTPSIFFQIVLEWTTCCPPINLQKKKKRRTKGRATEPNIVGQRAGLLFMSQKLSLASFYIYNFFIFFKIIFKFVIYFSMIFFIYLSFFE